MVLFPEVSPLRPLATAVAVMIALAASQARAVEPFAVQDIRVEGLQRTDPGTVFASLPFRIGDTYNDDKGATALRSLFGTGLFKDVRIEIEGNVVVVIVEERPVIQTVTFVGLKEFDREQLLKSLKESGIGEGLPFDKALVDRAEQEIKRQYLSRSLYGAEVVTTITPVERNRVNVTFTMTEGDAARIGEIRIVGNKVFSRRHAGRADGADHQRLAHLVHQERPVLARQAQCRPRDHALLLPEPRLPRVQRRVDAGHDLARQAGDLDHHHRQRGAAVHGDGGAPSRATFSARKRSSASWCGSSPASRTGPSTRPTPRRRSPIVSRCTATRSPASTPTPEIDRANGQVAITLRAEPQRRVYVRRVDVAGNTRTRDEVVRREFRQFEASWYDGSKIKLSRDRVDRLGYFKEVSVDTNEVAGSPDQVDLTVNVAEKPTGNLSLGVELLQRREAGVHGVGQAGQRVRLGQLPRRRRQHQQVLAHAGAQHGRSRTSRSTASRAPSTSTTARRRPLNSLGDEYQLATPGASIRFGVPFSDFDTVFFGIGAERTEIKGTTSIPNAYFIYRDLYGENSSALPLTIGWARDQRDSVVAPTTGRYARVNLEWSPFGDVRYLRSNFQVQQYFPLTQQVHPRPQRRARHRPGVLAINRSRSSRTSMAAAWARCACSSRVRWA